MIGVRNGTRQRARLAAVGSYVPEKIMTNADFEALVDTSDEWIVSRTGIRERRVAAPDQTTADLAELAARDILRRTNLDPKDLDLIIVPTTEMP